MKKTVLVVFLTLVVLASLVTGTLAVYTVEAPQINSGDVVAKQFVFVANGNEQFVSDVKIAPTENVKKTFTVANFNGNVISQTNMIVTINVRVIGDIAPLTIEVNGENAEITNNGNNSVVVLKLSACEAQTRELTVKIIWNSTDNDNQYMGKTSSIVVNAVAVQAK